MEKLFLIIAIIAIVTGVLLLAAPKLLIRAGEVVNRIFATDDIVFSRRSIFGALFIAAGLYMIYWYVQGM